MDAALFLLKMVKFANVIIQIKRIVNVDILKKILEKG